MNVVALTGNLTRDPELKQTQSGAQVCSFTLAVDRGKKSADGERQADFINCVAWDKAAELICQYTRKGHRLGVSGRLQSRTYDDRDGRRVSVTEVVVHEFQFLTPRGQEDPAPHSAGTQPEQTAALPEPRYVQVETNELPF